VNATLPLGGQEVHVHLCAMGGLLYGRDWRQWGCSHRLLATLKDEPSGRTALPVVTRSEIQNARVVVEPEKQVRFVLENREIVFDGSEFHFQ
jgi:hypothetical protein